MLDQVTSTDSLVLEGPVEIPQQRVRFFKNLSAACDFITAFEVSLGQFEHVEHPEHGRCVQLVYLGDF